MELLQPIIDFISKNVTLIVVITAIGVGFTIFQNLRKERSRFSCKVEKKYWYAPEKENGSVFYTIYLNVFLRNNGGRTTTVYEARISFSYKNKLYDRKIIPSPEIRLESGGSKYQGFNFIINENDIQIDSDPTNVILKIKHTDDDNKEYDVGTIPKL